VVVAQFEHRLDVVVQHRADGAYPGPPLRPLHRAAGLRHRVLDDGQQLVGQPLQVDVLVRPDPVQLMDQGLLPVGSRRCRLQLLHGLLESRSIPAGAAPQQRRLELDVAVVHRLLGGPRDAREDAADQRSDDG
jgi:hypothetical protein